MKKIFLYTLGVTATLLLSACAPVAKAPASSTLAVMNFEECVAAGNPVMESYPRQCRHEGRTFVEDVEIPAPDPVDPIQPDQPGETKPCTREFRPVCGEIQVQCIKAPCPPINITFSNRCEAENAKATNIVDGACDSEGDVGDDPKGACLSFDGNWIEETQECEGMGREQCEALGGTFNECASACRNDPEAEFCTLQCVLVCDF